MKEESEKQSSEEDKAEEDSKSNEEDSDLEYSSLQGSEDDDAMDNFMRMPPHLSFSGNLKENWTQWYQNLDVFMIATGLSEKDEKRKVAVLLNAAGPEALQKFQTFTFENEADKAKYDRVVAAFEAYCTPKSNETVERHIFNSRVQKEGESFVSFLTDLRKLAATCEFAQLKDGLIRDRILVGIRCNNLRARLLREEDLTLEKCENICKSVELSDMQLKTMNNEMSVNQVKTLKNKKKKNSKGDNANANRDGNKQASSVGGSKYTTPPSADGMQQQQQRPWRAQQAEGCGRCGRRQRHQLNECPARGKTCNACGGPNHFSSVCYKKTQVNTLEYEPALFVGHVGALKSNVGNSEKGQFDKFRANVFSMKRSDNVNNFEWFENVVVNGKFKLKVKLDTGAICNVITERNLRLMDQGAVIRDTHKNICAFGGSKIETLGACDLNCKFLNRKEAKVNFIVVQGPSLHFPTIIGLPTLTELNVVARVDAITNLDEREVFKKYGDIFNGNGVITNFEYDIRLKDGASGKIAACRKVPVALVEPLKYHLTQLEKIGLIERVTEPTEWVNPIVITKKRDGKIRLCLDPTELNKHILRQHHVIPSFDELCSRMPNAKIFSTLDADQAFWQIKLSKNSSDLVTFITPFGRFKFNVMPYGISSATEIFQFCFDQIFGDLEGVIILVDDILVWGENEAEHDARLEKVLERARDRNVKFNKNKCKFRKNSVKYVGHIFTDKGIKVDEDRVRSVIEMSEPNDKDELSTFLGILAYVGRFIPGLSDKSAVLRELIKKDATWVWDANTAKVFKDLKQVLVNAPVLKYYDVNKPVVLSVDASQKGLGAALLQDGLPVAYASKALTDTETRYAQIEKEALAIVFACRKYHQYIFGKRVLVESDHKPLEVIFSKPIGECPLRVQRMRLAMQRYDIEVRYKPGRELYLADALSRNFLNDDSTNIDCGIDEYVHGVMSSLPISLEKRETFTNETAKDIELQTLIQYIRKGWPADKSQLPECIRMYHTIAQELSEIEGLVFRGDRLVVPKSMRSEMLGLIHYCHLGVEKCKNRAREIFYWPFMNKQIEDVVLACNACNIYRRSKVKEPLMPRRVPDRPWQVIGIDLCHYKGEEHLLLTDYFSKYAELVTLRPTNSAAVIGVCKSVFSRLGIPEIVCSDGGPQLDSAEFNDFARQWGFKHDTSSPYCPDSNGMVERHIQTFKNMLRKVESDGRCPYLAVLEYRNTPIDVHLKSPNEIMFGRKVRGIVPARKIGESEYKYREIREKLLAKQQVQKEYHDRKSHVAAPVGVNQRVFVRKEMRRPLVPGLVVKKCERPRSFKVELDNGRCIERNTRHIYPAGARQTHSGRSGSRSCDVGSGYSDNYDGVSGAAVDTGNRNMNVARQVNVTGDRQANNFENETCTRSGRIVRTPSYLRDYVT